MIYLSVLQSGPSTIFSFHKGELPAGLDFKSASLKSDHSLQEHTTNRKPVFYYMPAASVTTAYYVHKEIQVCANFSVGIIKELINWNVILYHKLKKVYFFLNTSPSKGAAIRPQLSYHNGISSMDCTFSCMSKMSFHLCFYRFSLHFCFFFFFYFLIFFFFFTKIASTLVQISIYPGGGRG